MANELFEANKEFEELEKQYSSLLTEFRKKGDIDIFVDLQNLLLELGDRVKELPASEEKVEILCGITVLSNAINSLLFSAN